MSELYELHLARLQRDGFLDEDRWGPEVKSGKGKKRTGDGGVPPPADGGANTAGGKGRSGASRGGKNSGGAGGTGGAKKKKPLPPWMTGKGNSQPGRTARGVPPGSSEDRRRGGRGGNAKKSDWGREASRTEHESYRNPRGRDNGISRRLRNHDPHRTVDITRARGNGVSDARANDSRVNAVARTDKTPGIQKPGTGGAAGNPYTSGRSGNGVDTGRASGGHGTGVPGNVKKKRPTRGIGHQAGNPYTSGQSPKGPGGTPKPGNVRRGKSLYDYSPEQVEESINVITKALNGVLADFEEA